MLERTVDTSGGEFTTDGTVAFNAGIITEHFVSFEFDGRRENVEVELYNTLEKGDKGILTYKEDDEEFFLVDFER